MRINRRRFLCSAAATGAGLILARKEGLAQAPVMIDVASIPVSDYTPATPLNPQAHMFQAPLTVPPILSAAPVNGEDQYAIDVCSFSHQFHPALSASAVWGYGARGSTVRGYLGGIIFARKDRPVRINFRNTLPLGDPSLIPVDPTIVAFPKSPGGALVNTATSVHLHGGHVPWQSDGHPLAWFTSDPAVHGPFFDPAKTTATPSWQGLVGPDFWYPNDQSARFMWYHEHAVGLTRINAYSGVASAYIIRDAVEDAMYLGAKPALPPGRELFLVIQDKAFNIDGSLWYPKAPDPLALAPGTTQIPYPSCTPEMMGDVNVVNGVVWPKCSVGRARYRVRMLNAAQTRFYRLGLYYAKADGITPDFAKKGPDFNIFGTESGFLQSTAVVKPQQLVMAPAERFDMIVDFSQVPAGSRLILWNDAPAPFPVGVFPVYGMPVAADPAFLKEGCVMAFDVLNTVAETAFNDTTRVPRPAELWPAGFERLTPRLANTTFNFTLNEGFDEYGRLIQLIGGTTPTNHWGSPFGQDFLHPTTGQPIVYESHKAGNIEIWNIINVSADSHPMHTHLVDFQILSRQRFDVAGFIATQQLRPIGQAIAPAAHEAGWKETVQCPPGQITTIATRINPRTEWVQAQPDGCARYVWHCHILEHEEHDMMRQFDVVP